jgi:hypothetical protein
MMSGWWSCSVDYILYSLDETEHSWPPAIPSLNGDFYLWEVVNGLLSSRLYFHDSHFFISFHVFSYFQYLSVIYFPNKPLLSQGRFDFPSFHYDFSFVFKYYPFSILVFSRVFYIMPKNSNGKIKLKYKSYLPSSRQRSG